jgi:hypothetical protein
VKTQESENENENEDEGAQTQNQKTETKQKVMEGNHEVYRAQAREKDQKTNQKKKNQAEEAE